MAIGLVVEVDGGALWVSLIGAFGEVGVDRADVRKASMPNLETKAAELVKVLVFLL